MEGLVIEWIQTTEYSSGKIEDLDGNWWQVKGDCVEPDAIGRTLLEPGEKVFFDPGPERTTQKGMKIRRATNVQRPQKRVGIDLNSYTEIGEVLNERFIMRIKGGMLTAEWGNGTQFLSSGHVVRFNVRPPKFGTTWRAVGIEIIHPDASEYDWSSVYVEPTTQPVPEAPKSSILLSDRFKNMPLRSIGVRRITS